MTRGIVGLVLGLGLVGVTQKASADTVKVASGDTISQIAQEHNDTVDHIQKVNHLKDVDLVFPGDKIVTGKTNPGKRDIQVQQQPQVVAQAPVQQNKQSQVQTPAPAPKVAQTTNNEVSQGSSSAEQSIIHDESRGQANVSNGRYVGLYGMDASRLHGDYSVANQKAVAQKYMQERYGTWEKAWEFHATHNFW